MLPLAQYLFDYAVAQAVEWISPSRPAKEENALVKVGSKLHCLGHSESAETNRAPNGK